MNRLRILAVLLLPGLLPACADAPAAPRPSLSAGFVVAEQGIEIRARDPLPLRRAALILPGGASVPAHEIASTRPPPPETSRPEQPGVSIEGSGGSRSGTDTAIVLSLPVDLGVLGRERRASGRLIESRARIDVPDPAAYRRDWSGAILRLTFGDPPGEVRTVDFPAPDPRGE
ncbi:MAG: hypothetical protein HY057_01435 [Rhodospirillales bacterium]|nr:hypothetical protein [Rhodospirillales bacterium]